MPSLNTQSYTTILSNWAAAVQGACSKLLDFTVGSILRAIAQAMTGVALWLQGLILQLLAAIRLATSNGADVDSFVADFGLKRLPAMQATGQATLSRYTPTNAAFIPASITPDDGLGANIQTADGTETFTVVANVANPLYSPLLGGYTIPANTASGNVTVQALKGGTQGNISAGTLTVLQTGISGVDNATNAAAFTNGIDAETDAALKARFTAFINSLSKGTVGAFEYAITSFQQGLQYQIIENKDYNGATDNGMVTVIIDDGSGSTPTPTIAGAFNFIDAIRAAGIRFNVFAATKLNATVVMTIGVAQGFVGATVQAQVQAAVTSAINNTGLGNGAAGTGNTLDFMRLGQAAFDASPGVASVTGVTLNSGTADLTATALQTIKALSVTVNLAS